MMPGMSHRHIESASNPLVKELYGLRNRRARERSGTFLIEGEREVRRALEAGVEARMLVLAPTLLAPDTASALAASAEAAGAEVVTFGNAAFGRASLREGPDGVLLLAASRRLRPADLQLASTALVLVLAGLEKPGNVGALLRTADAVGADAVMLTGNDDDPTGGGASGAGEVGVDLENPNVVRAAMGSSFTLPCAVGSPAETWAAVRAAGLKLVATSPHADKAHWDSDLSGGVALALGNEHLGLSRWWLERAEERVTIPMRPRAADSLNVSVAGAILLYEASRQRARLGSLRE